MIILSAHQRRALAELQAAPKKTTELAMVLDLRMHAAHGMMSVLLDRGLVSVTRGFRNGPRRFVWAITVAGAKALTDTMS